MADATFKIILVGDPGVGKSSVLLRFIEDKFGEDVMNSGADSRTYNLTVDQRKCRLQIWDTAGEEKFRSLTSNYCRGAQGVIFVYDITNQESFDNIADWQRQLEKYVNLPGQAKRAPPVSLLCGNKTDLHNRVVDKDTAKEFAESQHMLFTETSAKTNSEVANAFIMLTRACIAAHFGDEEIPRSQAGGLKPLRQDSGSSKRSRCILF